MKLCFLSLTAALALPLLVAAFLPGSEQEEMTPAEVRAAVNKTYTTWGQARVAMDRETLDSMLSADFYVLMNGKRIEREKFLHDITHVRAGTRLSRFDVEILTVQKAEKDWTLVISEKLEITITGPDGQESKVCSHWITRDGWQKQGDRWQVNYSEAIGYEYWKPGETPPLTNW